MASSYLDIELSESWDDLVPATKKREEISSLNAPATQHILDLVARGGPSEPRAKVANPRAGASPLTIQTIHFSVSEIPTDGAPHHLHNQQQYHWSCQTQLKVIMANKVVMEQRACTRKNLN